MRFLKKGSEYKKIYRKHQKIEGKYFALLVQKRSSHDNGPALGIVVSRKVGKAVIRNRIKRRVRSYLNIREEQLPDNLFGIIIAGINAGNADWNATVNDLTYCFKKAKRLKLF